MFRPGLITPLPVRPRPRHALASLACLLLVGATASTSAATLGVRVTDRDGEPVPEVVVVATPTRHSAPATADEPTHAAVTQKDLAFAPHILIVETGTVIDFPNADDVLHHVYSFSPVRQFDMTVDVGTTGDGVLLETPGVVTLGCNVHDGMLGYIVVVDTPHYAKTGPDGTVELAGLAGGAWQIRVWTPRLAEKNLPEPTLREIAESDHVSIAVEFAKKLYPPHEHSETSLHWSHY